MVPAEAVTFDMIIATCSAMFEFLLAIKFSILVILTSPVDLIFSSCLCTYISFVAVSFYSQ